VLSRLADLIDGRTKELARIPTQEIGKRISEARSKVQVTAETILANTKIGDPMDESVEAIL
jgi:acyl-CoA reductase-like NAD-dependent aldehyde dehydrogenase